MENYIIVAILVIIVGLAAFYIYKAKKSGRACIGCPDSKQCSENKNTSCCSGCASCGMNCPSKQK